VQRHDSPRAACSRVQWLVQPVRRLYSVIRDLHLYSGLFISPLVLVFAVSVFFLVHAWIPGNSAAPAKRIADDLAIPSGVELLTGRDQVSALRGLLDRLGVKGEVGMVRRIAKEHRLVIAVIIPGREVLVDLNLETRSAAVTERTTGTWSAVTYLHKMPGQHLANLRGNWAYMRIWRWLADGTVYIVMFLTLSGVYLWAVLRAERRVGLALIAAGAVSFFGSLYALVR
jgi:hypothetical protein